MTDLGSALTLGQMVDRAAARFPDRTAVVFKQERISYADLKRRADDFARGLLALGLRAGDHVVLWMPNRVEWNVANLGIAKIGAVTVTCNSRYKALEVEYVLRQSDAKALILVDRFAAASVDYLEILRELGPGDRFPALRHVIVLGSARPAGAVGFEDVERAGRADGADLDAIRIRPEDPVEMLYTSGTTGEPKGCVHLHRELLATCDTFGARVLRAREDDVFTATPPLAFTFGLGVSVLFPLRVGASTVPIAQPSTDAVVEAIERHSITTLSTAPTMYRAMLRDADLSRVDSLRACVSAGEPLAAAVATEWAERTGVRIIDGIGSTEMLHIFIGSPAEEARPGSVGRPVPGYEAMVVDEAMRPVAPDVVGRLAVRGPTGCRYLDDPRQSVYVVDGWNVTGDAFRFDEDGYFWFAARTDDLIVSAGYNISPLEVESALLEHDAVAECAVVASPDEARGHVVKAFVVTSDGANAGDELAAELQQHVKERIAPYKYPRRIEFVDALPRTLTGKVQRAVLRKREGDAAAV
jgi:2-aminobenzoate-CoA ligase